MSVDESDDEKNANIYRSDSEIFPGTSSVKLGESTGKAPNSGQAVSFPAQFGEWLLFLPYFCTSESDFHVFAQQFEAEDGCLWGPEGAGREHARR